MNFQEQEQAEAGMRDMSKALFDYFQRLVDQGFTRDEAMQLTSNFQLSLMISGAISNFKMGGG